jgi:hypothetical protein
MKISFLLVFFLIKLSSGQEVGQDNQSQSETASTLSGKWCSKNGDYAFELQELPKGNILPSSTTHLVHNGRTYIISRSEGDHPLFKQNGEIIFRDEKTLILGEQKKSNPVNKGSNKLITKGYKYLMIHFTRCESDLVS